MCIICIVPKNNPLPGKDALDLCWANNPDGLGMMAVGREGRIEFTKTLKEKVAIRELNRFHAEHSANSPMVIHWRSASKGSHVTKDNIHPFRIGEEFAFCHNGFLSNYPCSSGKSDTLQFAELLRTLPHQWWKSKGIWELIWNEFGTSKGVFLRKDGKIYVVNAAAGVKDGPYWWSNEMYKQKRFTNQTIEGFTNVDFDNDTDNWLTRRTNLESWTEKKEKFYETVGTSIARERKYEHPDRNNYYDWRCTKCGKTVAKEYDKVLYLYYIPGRHGTPPICDACLDNEQDNEVIINGREAH